MTRVCIIGSTGLLGKALIKECKSRGYSYLGISKTHADVNVDITQEKELEAFFAENSFDVVINTVAIVNHKSCDDNPSLAYMVNSRPSAKLVELSRKYNFKYVYISTDGYFVDDGNKKHTESDKIVFLNEYAKTKYLGECFALTLPSVLVVRTNIVGFKQADTPTFFEWALNTIKNQNEITLFDDYYTSSISVALFAKALFDLIKKNACGLYNLASSEVTSKKEFIETLAKVFNLTLTNAKIGSVRSLPSKRADSLGLDVSKAENLLGYKLPNLMDVLKQLKVEYDKLQ